MLIATVLAIIIISYIEGVPLIKNKSWKEFFTFVSLLIFALLLVIGNQINLPGPIAGLDQILSPLGRSIFRGL